MCCCWQQLISATTAKLGCSNLKARINCEPKKYNNFIVCLVWMEAAINRAARESEIFSFTLTALLLLSSSQTTVSQNLFLTARVCQDSCYSQPSQSSCHLALLKGNKILGTCCVRYTTQCSASYGGLCPAQFLGQEQWLPVTRIEAERQSVKT